MNISERFAKAAGQPRHEITFIDDFVNCAKCSCGKAFRWLPFAHEHERVANPPLSAPALSLRGIGTEVIKNVVTL